MKKRFIIFYVATFYIVAGLSFAVPASSAILFYEDFEDALKTDPPRDWCYSTRGIGSQGLTTDQVRAGSSAYRFSVTGAETPGTYVRQNLALYNTFNNGSCRFTIGGEYWVGFSIFLAEGYHTPTEHDGCWGPVHQDFHGTPDRPPTCDPDEPYRHAPFQLEPWDMKWRSISRYSSHQCNELGDYEGVDSQYHGDLSIGCWTDFVYNFKWSYGGDGFFRIWKDGVLISNRTGGNCFNDDRGPYKKIGIYGDIDQGQEMTIYYDEVRIGDSDSSYAEVAPGGSVKPLPPTSVRIIDK